MSRKFHHGRSDLTDVLLSKYKSVTTPYNLEVFGMALTVDEEVCPPESDEITLLYLEETTPCPINEKMTVLDYGTGSGVFGIYAAKKGAEVIAVDINPKAVACAKKNAEKHGVQSKMTCLQSDGFSAIPKEKKFDIILASMPWESSEVDSASMDIAFYDPEFKMHIDLFDKGHSRLKPKGFMLISYSKRVEQINPIAYFTDHFDFEIVYSTPSFDGNEETYLFKAYKK